MLLALLDQAEEFLVFLLVDAVAVVVVGKSAALDIGDVGLDALLHASELFAAAGSEFALLGIEVTPKLNLPQMMQQKAESVGQLTKGIEFLFKKNKVDRLQGAGRIAGPGKINEVNLCETELFDSFITCHG